MWRGATAGLTGVQDGDAWRRAQTIIEQCDPHRFDLCRRVCECWVIMIISHDAGVAVDLATFCDLYNAC